MNRFVVVGAGGTGSHLLPVLLPYLHTKFGENNYGVFVVDGDDVEQKNLERQLFSSLLIGKNKARALVLQHEDEYRGHLVAITDYLSGDNIDGIITEGSTVLICVDNYPVRALIETYCAQLDNCVIINGGNERHTGTCQVYTRDNGVNITPRLSYMHPEISLSGKNRADMSCQEIAQLPGGEQLIVTNMTSAAYMLNALMMIHADDITWTEMGFDLYNPKNTWARDNREFGGWQ